MTTVSLCLFMILTALHAQAGSAELRVAPGVPFTAEQLQQAIALRTPHAVPTHQVTVVPATQSGWVVVTVGDATRPVEVGRLRGSAAARRVALVSLDLLQVARPPLPAPTTVASSWGGSLQAVASAHNAGGMARASYRLEGPLHLAIAAGVLRTEPAPATQTQLTSTPLRTELCARWSAGALTLEPAVAAIAAPQWFRTDDNGHLLSHRRTRFGAGVSLAAELPAAQHVAIRLAVGGDLYATNQRYLVGSETRYTTARWLAWLAVGVAFR